ncbi:MAG: penicillin-binding protein 2 [Litorivicinaceae bacterium]
MQYNHPRTERILTTQRVIIASLGCLALLLLLLGRLVWLQIVEHDRFVTASERNRIQVVPVAPPRGLIRDRQGILLADNRPELRLVLTPEESADLEAVLAVVDARIGLSGDERAQFYNRLQSRRRPYDPVVVKTQLSDQDAAMIAVDGYRFPELQFDATPRREYPYGHLTAHAVGYLGRLNAEELGRVSESQYAATDVYGKLGVERAHEETLHGDVGLERVETNARGRIMRVMSRDDPAPGADLTLHLDLGLQAKAYEILGDRRGAIVAMDPRTGGILALASQPTFDANLFVRGISSAAYQALQADPALPLFNRALRGQYPPGSTIKPMLGLVGLDLGVIRWSDRIQDPGFFQLPGVERRYRDWKRWGHGTVDLAKAVIESCDTYFYDIAVEAGIDRLAPAMSLFGFGKPVGQDVIGDGAGILPSREWKRAQFRQAWFPGETVIAGIGQGYWTTTPIQLAVATTALANRGTLVAPQFVQGIAPVQRSIPLATPADWERMAREMERVLHSPGGTAAGAGKDASYRMAGKTGTAQVAGLGQDEVYDATTTPEHLRDHALFVGFSPAAEPSLVLAIVLENAGSGGSQAGPVFRALSDYWVLDRQQGSLPPELAWVASVEAQLQQVEAP